MRTALGVPRVAGVAAFVLVLAVGSLPHGADQWPSGTVTLPERLAGYSYLTGEVSSSPPGRAVALFQHGFGVEFMDFPQAVVLGAGGDAYRRLDVAEDRAGAETQGDPAPMLLSPDGTAVAVGDHDLGRADLALVDLATGRETVLPLPAGRSVVPLAWSPDSRQVAYVLSDAPTSPHRGVPIVGDVGLVDVRSGRTTLLPAAGQARAAAFSPDGGALATSAGGELAVIDLDSGARRVVASAGGDLAGPAAWSPDGRLLVTTALTAMGASTAWSFVDATGRDEAVPGPLSPGFASGGAVLGWTDTGEMLVLLEPPGSDPMNGPDVHELSAVPVAGGEPRKIMEIHGVQNYGVARFQLASATTGDLRVIAPTDIDRGPLPMVTRIALSVLVGLAVWLVTGLVRRRRPRSVPPVGETVPARPTVSVG